MSILIKVGQTSSSSLKYEHICRSIKAAKHDVLSMSITQFATKINTSPSMVVYALKSMGFLGWKDYCGFVMGRIVIPDFEDDYIAFIQKVFFDRAKVALGWIDPFKINDAVALVATHRKINFLAMRHEQPLITWHIDLFRRFGIDAHFLALDNNEWVIATSGLAIMISESCKPLLHIIEHLLAIGSSRMGIINLCYGPSPQIPGVVNLSLPSERSGQGDECIPHFQKRTVITTVLDHLLIKWYTKHVRAINFRLEY